jgi:transcriptional pleiotropic repressor
MNLLTKTRRLNKLLQKAAGTSVNFMEMGEVLRDIIGANIYVVSRRGKILGCGLIREPEHPELRRMVSNEKRLPIPKKKVRTNRLSQKFKKLSETTM